jgi:hypothetical protein
MSIFRDFFVKEKPVFTGITRGLGGFGFGASGGGGAGAGGGPITASGGTTATYTEDGVDYKAHIFTHPNSDNFVVSATSSDSTLNTIEYIVVAGGGSGGSSNSNSAGGGGGGGVVVGSVEAVAQTYICSVGDGGNALGPGNGQGANGENSFFGPPSPGSYGTSPPNGISAMGGGAGAVQGRDGADGGTLGVGKDGGSGGGSCHPQGTGGAGNQPTITQGMGTNTNHGNDSGDSPSPGFAQGQGGGGAGGNPTPASYYPALPNANVGSTGGVGINNKYRTGSNIMYGAGGGADGYSEATFGGSGSPTSSRGGSGGPLYPGYRNGADGTGNGGGGASPGPEGSGPSPSQNTGGNGGSGIIVVRYRV